MARSKKKSLRKRTSKRVQEKVISLKWKYLGEPPTVPATSRERKKSKLLEKARLKSEQFRYHYLKHPITVKFS